MSKKNTSTTGLSENSGVISNQKTVDKLKKELKATLISSVIAQSAVIGKYKDVVNKVAKQLEELESIELNNDSKQKLDNIIKLLQDESFVSENIPVKIETPNEEEKSEESKTEELVENLTQTLIPVSNKSYKLDQSTPIFDNKDGKINVQDWILMVNNSLELAGVPENLKIKAITPFLRGTAFQLAKRFLLDGTKTWENFQTELYVMFTPVDFDLKIRTELLNLKQNESFERYANRFQYLVNQLKMSEEDKLTCFLQGLKPRTRTEIVIKNIDYYEDAMRLASNLESYKDLSSSAKINFVQSNKTNNLSNFSANKKTCFKCNKIGHWAKDCRIKPNAPFKPSFNKRFVKSEQKKSISCYNCKKPGHLSVECRNKSKKVNYLNNDVKDYVVCTMKKILNYNNGSDYSLVVVKGLVNGIQMKIGLDSGATCSIISKKTMEKYNLEMVESSLRIKTADNVIRNVMGTLEPVTINIDGHICELDELVVIDHEDHDVLLSFRLVS